MQPQTTTLKFHLMTFIFQLLRTKEDQYDKRNCPLPLMRHRITKMKLTKDPKSNQRKKTI